MSYALQNKLTCYIAILSLLCGFAGCERPTLRRAAMQRSDSSKSFKTSYITIASSDSLHSLIGYELRRGEQYYHCIGSCPSYNVVIGAINSTKDNYKCFCRDIVNDVIQKSGSDQIVVNIYDSHEACELSEAAGMDYKILRTEEEKFANEHRVAAYYFRQGYKKDETYQLSYYPDARNGLREDEYLK